MLKPMKSNVGFTTAEFAQEMQIKHETAKTRMREMFRLGMIELAGKKQIARMDGMLVHIPCYKLKKK